MSKLKEHGLTSIGMTTNGITLGRRVADLRKAGLDKLNVSLDTLVPPKFELITRRKGWQKVMDGLDAAVDHGYNPVKVSCRAILGFRD